ncbi:hypothetical protein [Roseibium sp.]|uniref:hypothetical protein n=1 Tax=Roseibium sp. TaxID=1936156 RepID=UPI003B514354
MSLLGKWRVVAMPDYTEEYPDMLEPAYLLLEEKGAGEFAFGCVTGQFYGAGTGNAVEFFWKGNDEMDKGQADGWVEPQPDGSLNSVFCFQGGEEANFVARRWTSSTAC